MTDNSEVLHGWAERSVNLARQIVKAVFMMAVLLGAAKTPPAVAQTTPQAKSGGDVACHVETIDYKGWKAEQISNQWVQLIVVAQNGGRVMQVIFDGHAYLFVNPKLAGQYLRPSQDTWFN